MWAAGFLLLFFGLLACGMPIFLVLGVAAGVLYAVTGQPLIGVVQLVIDQLNSTTLMALPLFVMAATFMRFGGVARALVDFATAWLGGVRGSLGLVTVIACTLFAAICGSSVA
ncbi:MAG: TRAP transporter large permease subunit, partial [Pseudomonadota bacterium]|nr:TRAP transporter large permease subunit [Pseudomonadota bacterium]